MVVHDLRVVAGHRPGHHVAHSVGEAQGQVVGLALAQHLGQVALGVYVQHEDFLSTHSKTGPQVIDGGAFAHAALLIRYAYHLGFRHIGVPFFSIDLAACGETGGYVRA
jgi:hypothetical protein